jgi:hypothetical protein
MSRDGKHCVFIRTNGHNSARYIVGLSAYMIVYKKTELYIKKTLTRASWFGSIFERSQDGSAETEP